MTPVAVLITIASYFLILFTISYIAGRKADNLAAVQTWEEANL